MMYDYDCSSNTSFVNLFILRNGPQIRGGGLGTIGSPMSADEQQQRMGTIAGSSSTSYTSAASVNLSTSSSSMLSDTTPKLQLSAAHIDIKGTYVFLTSQYFHTLPNLLLNGIMSPSATALSDLRLFDTGNPAPPNGGHQSADPAS